MADDKKVGIKSSDTRKSGRTSLHGNIPAKLTRPRLAKNYCRTRLIEMLDHAFVASAVWLGAPPGTGKTSLAASWLEVRQRQCLWYQVDNGDADLATFFHYLGLAARHIAPRHKKALPALTSEYLQGLETFSRRFFEELFRRMPQHSVVVFDNFQQADGKLDNILQIAIESLPEHVKILCLSRTSPPPEFARLQVNGQLTLLEPAAISLTLAEAEGLALLRGESDLAKVAAIHYRTHGWTAGLVLLLSELEVSGMPGERDPQTMFNYFAAEVFRGLDNEVRQFLMKSALLPKMRVHDLESLTEYEEGAHVLADLARRNYFTYRLLPNSPVYEYHPMFREYLLARLNDTCEISQLKCLCSQAAQLLAVANQIEEAANLWVMAQDWEALSSHIKQHAAQFLSEGRALVVESWIAALPSEVVNAEPWLQFWRGACLLAFNPAQAREKFESAFELFEERGDVIGQCQSWANIVDSFNYEWRSFKQLDYWINVMDDLMAKHAKSLPPEIEVRVASAMLNALSNHQPSRSDLHFWAERVERAILSSDNVPMRMMLGNSLILYYLCVSKLAKIDMLIKELKPAGGIEKYDPLTRQLFYVMESMYSWIVADWATCRRAIADGLKNSEESGVHILDFYLLAQGVYGGLSLGDPVAVEDYMAQMSLINSPRWGDKALHHCHVSSIAWHHCDFVKAVEHGKQAVNMIEAMGWPVSLGLCLIELSVTLFDSGQHDEAEACIDRTMAVCSGMNGLEFFTCMYGASYAFCRNKKERGSELLQRGLVHGKQYGFLNIPRWNNARMSVLLAKALELEVETEYVRKLIRKRELAPPVDAPESWPWPIKIRTLGSFGLECNGVALLFSGKVQKKSMELLKAIIALGGKEVSCDQLSMALWPDAEGDKAYQSLEVTLHRLRKLMGNETAILRTGGRVSLNTETCRCDAFVFEKIADEALDANCAPARLLQLAEIVSGLYKGLFLADEQEANWAIACRERLGKKYVRLIKKAGEALERAGQAQPAIALYHKALDVELAAEELYLPLMLCLRQQGLQAEAISVYKQCRQALFSATGAAPSAATEAFYRSLTAVIP